MQRVEALGVGLRADDEEDAIRQVHKILKDPVFSLNAQDFRRRFMALDGPANAALRIAKLSCPGAIRGGAVMDIAPSKTAR